MPYRLLWGERVVRSVANLTGADAEEFLALAGQAPIRTHVVSFALSAAKRRWLGAGRPADGRGGARPRRADGGLQQQVVMRPWESWKAKAMGR